MSLKVDLKALRRVVLSTLKFLKHADEGILVPSGSLHVMHSPSIRIILICATEAQRYQVGGDSCQHCNLFAMIADLRQYSAGDHLPAHLFGCVSPCCMPDLVGDHSSELVFV